MRPSQYSSYIAPSIILAFLSSPMGVLQGIYAKHFGVALTTIASVLLVSRLFDAVSDPLIGYWSDYYRSKSGSRKPFVVVGGLLFFVSSYCLYVPVDPDHLNTATSVSTTYFLGWFLTFYLAWTIVEIPHLAWGSELAGSTKAKNKLYSLRAMSTYLGILLFYLVPFVPFFPDNSFTPQTLKWAAIAAGLFLLPALYFCVKLTPNGSHVPSQWSRQDNLWLLRTEILANKPFLLFIIAFALYGMGAVGMFFTLMFIYIDTYLGLGEYFAVLSVIGICCGLLSIIFWWWLANRVAKKNVWIMGLICYVLGVLGASFLEPGKVSILALAVVMIAAYVGSTPVVALSPSLLADIIDFSTWKFGADRAATYFSLYTLVLKTSTAIGGAMGFGLAGWYGFEPTVVEQTAKAIFGLRLATCWLPSLLMLISILVMALVPMDARRHGIIRRHLDKIAARRAGQCKTGFASNTNLSLKTTAS